MTGLEPDTSVFLHTSEIERNVKKMQCFSLRCILENDEKRNVPFYRGGETGEKSDEAPYAGGNKAENRDAALCRRK